MELSIIMPVYNVEKYLEKSIRSCLAIEKIDYELIIIDDGSTDGSFKIVEKYLDDKRIKVFQKGNGGQSSARNMGLNYSSGKYIFFIDSDDTIDTKKFEKFFKKTKESNVDIATGNCYLTFEDNRVKQKRERKENKEKIMSGRDFFTKKIKLNSLDTEVWINLYKKSLLNNNNLRFKEGIIYEDALFITKAFYYAKKTSFFDISFYNYLQRDGSTINSHINEKHKMSFYIVLEELINFFEEKKIDNKYWNEFLVERYWGGLRKYKMKSKIIEKKIINLNIPLRKIKLKQWLIPLIGLKSQRFQKSIDY